VAHTRLLGSERRRENVAHTRLLEPKEEEECGTNRLPEPKKEEECGTNSAPRSLEGERELCPLLAQRA